MHLFDKDSPKKAAEDMILWNETVEIHILAAVLFQSYAAFPPALTRSWSEIVPKTGWRLFHFVRMQGLDQGSSTKLTVTEHAGLNTQGRCYGKVDCRIT